VGNRKFVVFTALLGVAAAILAAPIIPGALVRIADVPAAAIWLVLAVLATVLPVRGVAGVTTLNISQLPLLTMLLLHGTGPALIASLLTGIAATVSSRTGNLRTDLQRAILNSAKHALSLLAAGWILWGASTGAGAIEMGIERAVFIRLLGAHAGYFLASAMILSFGLWLRDGRDPFEVWRANFGWGALVSWSTPLGAYLLALFFLEGGFLLIGILVAIGLIGILTVRDHVRIKSSVVHLVDALRLARDGNMPHLRGETRRVVELSVALGHKMRLPYRNLEVLEQAAMLHNVGYIAVDRDTVLKRSLLNDSEMNEIREHPESGMRILREVVGMGSVAAIVRCHHESPDGTGYPRGLRGKEIPLEAAIIKVAEAYVALTSQRPHRRKVFTKDQALDEIARAAGHSLDATVAYFLFEMMGRNDLAAKAAKGFGPPAGRRIKERLHKGKARPFLVLPRRRDQRRSMAFGACFVAVASLILFVFTRLGVSGSLGFASGWITCSPTGSLFFMLLLGLAALKPVRLPWGAYISSSSAIVLVMALVGGPLYAVMFGFAAVGWAMLLDPGRALSSSAKIINGLANGTNGFTSDSRAQTGYGAGKGAASGGGSEDAARNKSNGGITGVIKSKTLGARLSTASAYGFVLMLAGCGAWWAHGVGSRASTALGLQGTAGELMPFALATGVFYVIETMIQSALLSRDGISATRLWQRNYLKVFPEPLTYAACGYAILVGDSLLGLWAALPLFLFPTLWRHLALLRRQQLLKTQDGLIRAIAKAVDEKDRYTGGHSASVVEISVAVAREMGKSEPFVEQIEEAAIRHDLGKVSWPNQVLRKPARLDEYEEEEYKRTHPDVSADIASCAGSSAQVADMIRYHHERYDGLGYPHGLKGDDTPIGARILCVADSFDAMIHDRWYKRKRTLAGAVEEIRRCRGSQFDPRVVDAFLRVVDKMDLESIIEAVEIEVGEIREEVGAAH
jgi:HD-GYP domain-containing protein (c-di-GMP phosphodiesterase class II)